MTSIQEMQWVLRAQCRDRDALEALLRSVQPSLRRYLAGVAGTTDADDLLQDVLVIIARRIGGLEEPKLLRELLATEAISPASRAVLILRYEEELPLGEIAAILDIPVGTVKSRLAYGLSSIRRQFKAPGGSDD